MDYRVSLSVQEKTAWLRLWGHEQGDPGKHTFCTALQRARQVFFPSLFYRFIDNKLSVITVPDRYDLTWPNSHYGLRRQQLWSNERKK